MSLPAKLCSLSGEPSPRDSLARPPMNHQPRSTGTQTATAPNRRRRATETKPGGSEARPNPASRQERTGNFDRANRDIIRPNREGVEDRLDFDDARLHRRDRREHLQHEAPAPGLRIADYGLRDNADYVTSIPFGKFTVGKREYIYFVAEYGCR